MSKMASRTQNRATSPNNANFKVRTKTHASVRPQTLTPTGRNPQVSKGSEKPPARKAPLAAIAKLTAPISRAKGGATPAATIQAVAVPATRRPSKVASIAVLLRRPEGAAIADLMAATGWQQHSVRAALTGLRRQGHHLTKEAGPAGSSIYRITQEQLAKA